MSAARDVLQKLLRSPKPRKKSDLLNQREYNLLAATSFEQFLAENLNEDQIGKLCAAEMEQLHFHYTEMEKRSVRTMKKIRGKGARGTTGTPRVVVRNVPAASVSASSIVRAVQPVPVDVPEAGADPVLENIENAIEESRENRGGDRIEELNVSLERIDLSRVMAPRELLLEEAIPAEPIPELVEIDLGAPGDAGAFLGSTDPMPMDDPQVREQVLSEFPSLRRPHVDRRYEDMDEDLNARLMPPPNVPATSGISSSTPITADTQLRRRAMGAIDLSSIKYPTPAVVDALLRSDESSSGNPNVETVATSSVEVAAPDISSIPHPEEEQHSTSNVDSGLPTSTEIDGGPLPETMQTEPVPEPIQDIQPPPTPREQPQVPPADSSSTSSSSSSERPTPTRGAISRTRRVPEYDTSKLVIKFHTRTTVPLTHHENDDVSLFETDQQLIERLLQIRSARNAADHVAQRQVVPQAVEDQQASLRDISSGAANADVSSIREPPSGSGGAQLQTSLYYIPERPHAEDREELALRKSMSAVPTRTAALGDSLELSAKRVDLLVEPVIDVPEIVVTATVEADRGQPTATVPLVEPVIVEKPQEEIPIILPLHEVPVATGDGQRPEDRPGENLEQVAGKERDDKKFTELLKLYLNINHAAKTTHHGTLSMEHLQVLECAPRNKLNCCKLFAKLLELKKYGLIETGIDERGRIRSVTVKQ